MATLTVDMSRYNSKQPSELKNPACGSTKWRLPPRDLPPERLYKTFNLFVNKVNDQIYGKNWKRRKQGIRFAVARELQKRGVSHFHALLAYDGTEWLDYRWGWHTWWGLLGGSDFARPHSQEQVCGYVAKYLAKGYDGQVNGRRSGEIEMSAPWTWEAMPALPPLPLGGGG